MHLGLGVKLFADHVSFLQISEVTVSGQAEDAAFFS